MKAINNSIDQKFGYGANNSERLRIYHTQNQNKYISIRDLYEKK